MLNIYVCVASRDPLTSLAGQKQVISRYFSSFSVKTHFDTALNMARSRRIITFQCHLRG